MVGRKFGLTREGTRQSENGAYRRIRALYRRKNPAPESKNELEEQALDLIEVLVLNVLPQYKDRASWHTVIGIEELSLRDRMTQKYGVNMISSLNRASKNGRLNFDSFPEFKDLKRLLALRTAVKNGSFDPDEYP